MKHQEMWKLWGKSNGVVLQQNRFPLSLATPNAPPMTTPKNWETFQRRFGGV